jgi:hypothetical protein
MDGGITKVRGDGISAVDGMNALEVLRYLVKSFVPPEALPTVRSPAHGIFQPVFIVVQILQGDGLRADVPAAEGIVFVASDVETLDGLSVRRLVGLFVRRFAERILNSDFDATNRFAEIAVAIMN